MDRRKRAFTLIELIIVVVIISILALIAIPKYYANVTRSQRNAVYSSLAAIREALLSYYATKGAYPTADTWPITVTVDGDTIINLGDPSNAKWRYAHHQSAGYADYYAIAYIQSDSNCYHAVYATNGSFWGTANGSCSS